MAKNEERGYLVSGLDGIPTVQHPRSTQAVSTSSISHHSTSSWGGPALRQQVARLQVEMDKLREHQEMQEM